MAITKIQSESLNLADTYAFTGTVTGAGGVNTPYLEVVLSTVAVTLTSGVASKIPFNVTKHNIGGGTWDGTNYRYTPGVAGRYMVDDPSRTNR